MKEQMERFIKHHYPDAVLDSYSKSVWGEEYLFYPTADASIISSHHGFIK